MNVQVFVRESPGRRVDTYNNWSGPYGPVEERSRRDQNMTWLQSKPDRKVFWRGLRGSLFFQYEERSLKSLENPIPLKEKGDLGKQRTPQTCKDNIILLNKYKEKNLKRNPIFEDFPFEAQNKQTKSLGCSDELIRTTKKTKSNGNDLGDFEDRLTKSKSDPGLFRDFKTYVDPQVYTSTVYST